MRSLLLLCFTALISLDPSLVLGGQIPVVDGVLGGVPTIVADTVKKADILTPAATTPGKLRVVENSGICGIQFVPYSYSRT